MINGFFTEAIIQDLGWTLIHSSWQGTVIALLLAILLRQPLAAKHRYIACCVALLLMLALPVTTFFNAHNTRIRLNQNIDKSFPFIDNNNSPSQKLPASPVTIATNITETTPVVQATTRSINFASLLPWLVLLWSLGVIVFSLRIGLGLIAAQRLKRELVNVSLVWQQRLITLSQRLLIKPTVRLYQSTRVEVPTVIGWLKPMILMPASIMSGMNVNQIEAILAHELAHIRRYDYLINLLQTLIEILFFFHPASWWISRQIRIEREHCCDDLAVEACGDPLVYARALTELAALHHHQSQLAIAATGGSLFMRIERLLKPSSQTTRTSPWLAGFILIVLISTTMVGASTYWQKDQLNDKNVATAKTRKVAIKFVSFPSVRGAKDSLPNMTSTVDHLIASLSKNNIPAIAFVGESKLNKAGEQEQRAELLERWLDAGFELGNETYSHPYLFKMPLADFQNDVIQGETVTKKLLKARGRELKYFSYPFLNTGPNLTVKRDFEQFLQQRGYQIAPVTIDNMDWLFAKVYREAGERGDREMMQRVVAEYIPYMERMMAFYEQFSSQQFGYQIPQVLMLTTSELNADHLDKLIVMLQRRGYQFINLEQALTDKAYQHADNYTGPVGISWLQRWAITDGGSFLKEPVLPEFMKPFDNPRASASTFKN